ncbi:MAG: hypothetical protein SFY96_02345 [Planctomycetota bacterium]|nr:hypothetical protein [Planctomycetota bacterium]
MKCACGASLSSVVAMLGLVGLGAAGYNTIRTGCPLGTCASTAAATDTAVVTPAGGPAVVGSGGMMNDEGGLSCCERKARGEKQECCPDDVQPEVQPETQPESKSDAPMREPGTGLPSSSIQQPG